MQMKRAVDLPNLFWVPFFPKGEPHEGKCCIYKPEVDWPTIYIFVLLMIFIKVEQKPDAFYQELYPEESQNNKGQKLVSPTLTLSGLVILSSIS